MQTVVPCLNGLMERLLALLLVCCFQLPASLSASYVIGIIYDDSAPYAEYLPAVVSHLRSRYSSGANTATVALTGATFDHPNITVCELLPSNTVALMIVGSCQFSSYISMAVRSSLPFSRIRVMVSEPCPLSPMGRDEFSMFRRYTWLPQVIIDLCHHMGFSRVVLVYSDMQKQLAFTLSAYLSAKQTETALATVQHCLDPYVSQLLHSHWIEDARNTPILAIVTRSDMELLLSRDTGSDYWFVFTGDAEVNMTRLWGPHHYFIQPDIKSFAATDILDHIRLVSAEEGVLQQAVRAGELLVDAVSQIATDGLSASMETACSLANNSTISDVAAQLSQTLSTTTFDTDGYLRVDKYRVVIRNSEGVLTAAKWTTESGLTTQKDFTPRTPLTFKNTVRVGTEVVPPFTNKTGNSTWEGFCIDMLEELAFRVGFKYTIIQSEDGLWGSQNADGTWNGLVGMAINNKIDMAIGPISINPERATVVDFTKPYMESAGGIMMRRFEDTTAKMFRTLMPFTFDVWVTLAGFVVVIGIAFGVINRFSPVNQVKLSYEATFEVKPDSEDVHVDSSRVASDKDPDRRLMGTILDSAWVVYGSFMEQGAENYPRSPSGRVVLGLWWVFTILTTASYTASLAAFLTFSMNQVPINSIYDLAQQSDIKPLVKSGTNLHTLFLKGETDAYRRIRDMMLTIAGNAEGMDLVMEGPYALLTDREQLDLLQKQDCQQLVQGKEYYNNNGLAFFVREGSPLLEPLSYNMIKLMEAGLIDKWRRKWWSSKDVCLDEVPMTSGVQSLELDSTAGPFIIYAAFTLVAILILLAERAYASLWPACTAMVNKRTVEM